MLLIDTHSHVNFNAYKDDADEVINRGGVWLINVGSQYATSKRAVDMAEKYPKGVYAAIGLHPIHVNEEEFDYENYKVLAKSKKVVAIGETGLDYFHKPYDKNLQRTGLCQQLGLAKELNLPVIFHCRSAHDDLIEILKNKECNNSTDVNFVHRGVVHCFTGNWQDAEKYLAMGFYLGFNGIIFKLNLDDIIKKVPLNKILIETDCPYLTPKPMEGRNEPLYVKYVAEKISEIKNISFEKVAEITTKNAKLLFRI